MILWVLWHVLMMVEKVFCATALTLNASESFFPAKQLGSLLNVRITSGKARTHSILRSDEPLAFKKCSCAYWCPNTCSASVRLNLSTMPWSRWVSTLARRALILWFAINWLKVRMNSRPGSICSKFGRIRGPLLYNQVKASATSEELSVRDSAYLYLETMSTTVSVYL